MPTTTYSTANSQHSFSVPVGAAYIDLLVRAGAGGAGGDYDGTTGTAPSPGGAAAEISASLPVSGGESLPVYVGEGGSDGVAGSDTGGTGGAAGSSPLANGGAGGDAGNTYGGGGGGGGAPSALEHPDGTFAALAEGGGGGGGGGADLSTTAGGGGGGGGARGGLGASGGAGDDSGFSGSDAAGTGSGGDGGVGGEGGDPDFGADPSAAGADGGAVTHADLTNVTTTTSTSSPIVELTTLTLTATTGLTVDSVSPTSISVSWDAPTDDRDGHRVLWRQDGEASWTNSSTDLDPSTTSYEITGLLHGQKYDIAVEAFLRDKTVIDAA